MKGPAREFRFFQPNTTFHLAARSRSESLAPADFGAANKSQADGEQYVIQDCPFAGHARYGRGLF